MQEKIAPLEWRAPSNEVLVNVRRLLTTACAAFLLASPVLAQTKTIRAVMHSDLKVLDPIWTTANIVRNHGYMVWDTLFAMDEAMESSRKWSTAGH